MKRYIYKIFKCQVPNAKCQVVGTWRAMFSTLSAIVIGFILGTSLSGCTDELKGGAEDNKYGLVTLSILEPELELGTRAKVTEEEAVFSNIYLVTVQTTTIDESNKETTLSTPEIKVHSLTGKHTNSGTTYDGTHYKNYSVSLPPGKYKFYVYVNYDRYLAEGNEGKSLADDVIKTQSDIDNLSLNYKGSTIQPGHLPMLCLPDEMKKNGALLNSGIINIEKGTNTEVVAPVTILCAKVRYTILFDANANGISKGFGDKRISFTVNNTDDRPYASIHDNKVTYGEELDLTYLITNPNLNYSSTGWTINPGTNDYDKYHLGRHYDENFNCYQIISNINPGLYQLEVNGFYRYGRPYSWADPKYPQGIPNEKFSWQAHNDGTEKLNAYLFINDSKMPLKSLYDEDYGTNYTATEGAYPFFEAAAGDAFSQGKYKNILNYILQEKGSLTIGVKKEVIQPCDWVCFNNFKLSYQKITITEEGERTQYIDLGKYDWPEDDENYPQSYNDELPLTNSNDTEWIDQARKAWQGIVYLPENISTEKENKTILHFPYCFGNQSTANGREKTIILFDDNDFSKPTDNAGFSVKHGLERGMMYDIVIKVVKSEIEEDQFTLNVRVKDWKYNPEESSW